MLRSIRARIGLPFILLILGIMLGTGIYLSNFDRQAALQSLEERLAAEALVPILGKTPNPALLDSMARGWAETISGRVTIIATDGTVIGESEADRQTMDNHATRPEILQAAATGLGISSRHSETVGALMAAGLAAWLAGRVTRPLSDLTAAARQMPPGRAMSGCHRPARTRSASSPWHSTPWRSNSMRRLRLWKRSAAAC